MSWSSSGYDIIVDRQLGNYKALAVADL